MGLADQIEAGEACTLLAPKERLLIDLAKKITEEAWNITDGDIDGLRGAGWSDEEIVEAVHTACQFNYMVRLADTLGVTAADVVGDRSAAEAAAEARRGRSEGPEP